MISMIIKLICISNKNRQHNDQRRSTKGQTTKDRATRTPLKTGGELMYSGKDNQSLLH